MRKKKRIVPVVLALSVVFVAFSVLLKKNFSETPPKNQIVCAGLGKYSFEVNSPWLSLAESNTALILQVKSGLLLISKKAKKDVKLAEILAKESIDFMSTKRGEYTVSLLYDMKQKEEAEKTFTTVVSSIKGGCSDR